MRVSLSPLSPGDMRSPACIWNPRRLRICISEAVMTSFQSQNTSSWNPGTSNMNPSQAFAFCLPLPLDWDVPARQSSWPNGVERLKLWSGGSERRCLTRAVRKM